MILAALNPQNTGIAQPTVCTHRSGPAHGLPMQHDGGVQSGQIDSLVLQLRFDVTPARLVAAEH